MLVVGVWYWVTRTVRYTAVLPCCRAAVLLRWERGGIQTAIVCTSMLLVLNPEVLEYLMSARTVSYPAGNDHSTNVSRLLD